MTNAALELNMTAQTSDADQIKALEVELAEHEQRMKEARAELARHEESYKGYLGSSSPGAESRMVVSSAADAIDRINSELRDLRRTLEQRTRYQEATANAGEDLKQADADYKQSLRTADGLSKRVQFVEQKVGELRSQTEAEQEKTKAAESKALAQLAEAIGDGQQKKITAAEKALEAARADVSNADRLADNQGAVIAALEHEAATLRQSAKDAREAAEAARDRAMIAARYVCATVWDDLTQQLEAIGSLIQGTDAVRQHSYSFRNLSVQRFNPDLADLTGRSMAAKAPAGYDEVMKALEAINDKAE